jgi:hypothetical protein
MRTALEFNNTYSKYLRTDEEGLLIDEPQIIKYLDSFFQQLIKIPDFEYEKIDTVMGIPRVITNLSEILGIAGHIIEKEIKDKLILILKVEYELEKRLASLNLDKNGKSIQSI